MEAEDFSVWCDARIGGGTNWRDDIQDHLGAARCVIVVWTRRSVGREGNFVRDEATRAQRRGVYLPVRLDAVEPPLGFGEVQAIRDQAYFSEGIAEELRGALSRIGLEVIGRASSDAVKDVDTKVAASKLGVANVLTGSVRRSWPRPRVPRNARSRSRSRPKIRTY